MFPHGRSYGGVCCLVTATVILPVNKTLHNTVVFSLLVTNTEGLLTTKFPLSLDSLFLPPPSLLQVGFFLCPSFREKQETNCHRNSIVTPLFISLFPDPLSHGKCNCQCALRLQSCGKFGLACG